jgi:hypothetical protein
MAVHANLGSRLRGNDGQAMVVEGDVGGALK